MGKFLSTLPARGATPDFQAAKAVMNIFLSTLPARGATEGSVNSMKAAWISIHAPREGSDRPIFANERSTAYFYPRSPRGERPRITCTSAVAQKNFYPRSPRGERRVHPGFLDLLLNFYPRSPRGERLWQTGLQTGRKRISIHAPREGSDRKDV